MRYPLEVFEAVRDAFRGKSVSVRVSGTDWVDGGWDIEQTCAFAKMLEERGCDAIHISSGGLDLAQQIPVGPSYQVPLARAVKSVVRMPVVTVGLITASSRPKPSSRPAMLTWSPWRVRLSTIRVGPGTPQRSSERRFVRPNNIFGPNPGDLKPCSRVSK
jgi:hypothetical protein